MRLTPVMLRISSVFALALSLITPLIAAADDAQRDLPPNFVAQHLGGPIANFVLPPGGTSGPTSANAPVTAFRFKLQGTLVANGVPGGGTLAFTATGEVVGADRMHVLITANGAGIPTPQAAEVIVVGSDAYFRTLTPTGKGAGQWIKADNAPTGLRMTDTSTNSDILNGTALLTNVSGTQTLPDETVNGTLTTHLRMNADTGLASDTFTGTGITMPQSIADAYIGKSDGKVRRITLAASAQIDPAALGDLLGPSPSSVYSPPPTRTVMVAFTLTTDFTDFNDVTIAITPPANAVPLSQADTVAGGVSTGARSTPSLGSPRIVLPPSGSPSRGQVVAKP